MDLYFQHVETGGRDRWSGLSRHDLHLIARLADEVWVDTRKA
jgi:hypothetical protein